MFYSGLNVAEVNYIYIYIRKVTSFASLTRDKLDIFNTLHAEKSFLRLVNQKQIRIVINLIRFIWKDGIAFGAKSVGKV